MAGRVLAVFAGPPCGTWSVSRFNELSDMTRGPRPVRSPASPWGIPGLKRRERRDVELGSQLLRATVGLMYVAAAVGAIFIMEHPAEPTYKPECPSSWRLPELQHAFQHLGVRRALIHQCALGAPSMKPTELAIANAPSLADQASVIRCPGRGHKHVNLMRRGADGSFGTAVAKEYPQPCAPGWRSVYTMPLLRRSALPGSAMAVNFGMGRRSWASTTCTSHLTRTTRVALLAP